MQFVLDLCLSKRKQIRDERYFSWNYATLLHAGGSHFDGIFDMEVWPTDDQSESACAWTYFLLQRTELFERQNIAVRCYRSTTSSSIDNTTLHWGKPFLRRHRDGRNVRPKINSFTYVPRWHRSKITVDTDTEKSRWTYMLFSASRHLSDFWSRSNELNDPFASN